MTSQQDLQGRCLISHDVSGWRLSIPSGFQTASALFLLVLGLLALFSYAFSFVRMLLSVFVLAGKPVTNPSASKFST